MAVGTKFLHPLRVKPSLSISSILSPPRIPLYGKFEPLNTFVKSLELPAVHIRHSSSNWKVYIQKYLHMSNFCSPGRKFSMGRLFGMSLVLGSVGLWPRFANSIDGYATLADDHSMGLMGASDSEENRENRLAFWIFAKKLIVPVALLVIVWMNWGHPVILAAKVIVTLLSTKPSPFSVYVFIEQLQRQYKGEHPLLYKFKPFYAKKVEVEDYTFFCVAKVEIRDQKFTLIGILGGWWVFEMRSLQGAFGAFGAFRDRTLQILETAML